VGRADERQPLGGRQAQRLLAAPGAVLNDGDDEVGIELAEAEASGLAEQSVARFGPEDGGPAALEGGGDAAGEHPPRIDRVDGRSLSVGPGDFEFSGCLASGLARSFNGRGGASERSDGPGGVALRQRRCSGTTRVAYEPQRMAYSGLISHHLSDSAHLMPSRPEPADTLASMTPTDAQPKQPVQPDDKSGDGLADLRVSLTKEQVLERLGAAARRGKLPEYARGGPENALFSASALGHPFDRDLLGWAEPDDDGLQLRFGLRWRKKAPILYIVAMIVTVEPGRYFLDVMIPGSWGWGSIMWWYYPLTILSIPFMWLSFVRSSRKSTMETARESHEAIRSILGDGATD